jgi:alkanesulfonate monooxygenase SsuD/methylene tetrahydromethanopterin reductase-like flavin-dependent oxidoreductase (luciferase family)
MKFALHFGNIAFSDPEGARRLVRLAEAAGFDSVFAVEHVVFSRQLHECLSGARAWVRGEPGP